MKFSQIAFLFGSLQHASKANGENLRGDRKLDNVFEEKVFKTKNPPDDKLETPLPSALQEKLDNLSPEKQAEIRAQFAKMDLDLDGDYVDMDGQGDLLMEYPAPPEEFLIQDSVGPNGQQHLATTSYEPSGVPIYHSKPGSKYTLYLDFDGHSWSGHAWAAGKSIDAKPYDIDGNPDAYSALELSYIGNAWAIVSEDFAPFDIDVTTEAPDLIDDKVGHVLMTENVDKNGETIYPCSCGGVAYVDVFGRTGYYGYSKYYSPALVFNKDLVGMSEAISHEFGHNLGLYHDGKGGLNPYYYGHGTGETDWAPIMGIGYYSNTVQWSKGEYTGATSGQDDLAIIAAKLGYSADDHAADTPLAVTGTDGFGEGLIKRSTDEDSWIFQAGGSITVTVSTPPGRYGNLDAGFRLVNKGTQVTVMTVQPEGQRSASWTGIVNKDEYAVVVFSSGHGVNADVGYTNYGSLGQYEVTVEGVLPPAQASSSPSSEPSMSSAPAVSPALTSFSPSLSPSSQPSLSPLTLACPASENEDFRCPAKYKKNSTYAYICRIKNGEEMQKCVPQKRVAWNVKKHGGYCGACKSIELLTCPHENEKFRCPQRKKKNDPAYAYLCHVRNGVSKNRCVPRAALTWHNDKHDGYCGKCDSD